MNSWRETIPEAPAEDLGFVESIAKFTEAAPEPVQDVIIDATRHAIEELRLPAYWEPKSVADVEKFALAQRAFLARLEADARPAQTIEYARRNERFYQLAVEAVIESLTPRPYEPLKLHHEWLNPMLRRDPLNFSAAMRSKIDAQPQVLRGFFDDLVREVKRAGGAEQNFADRLKADPDALREHFDAVFARYEREHWRRVDPEDLEVQVRARFLRFLSLGGDDFAPVHESRLELHGASVHEDLDLSGCTIPQPLLFRRSHFAGRISFRDSVTKSLTFSNSHVQSIDAESAQIRGGVFLEDGFRSSAGASLAFATIGGRLSCSGSLFDGGSGLALTGDEARIAGDVELADSFLGRGGVSLNGAKIEGKLHCARGRFQNRTEDGSGVALGCDDAEIMGGARLSGGFRSEGLVSFSGANIGGTFDCSGGTFLNRTPEGKGEALSLALARIAESVELRDGFSAEGKVRLSGTHVAGDVQCIGGRFDNSAPAKDDRSIAASAISLRSANIEGILWLGPPAGNASGQADIVGSLKSRKLPGA